MSKQKAESRKQRGANYAVPLALSRVGGSKFKELTAYKLATALANDVRSHALSWPNFDRWSLGIQLVRAADSVGANIAEAAGRYRSADRTRFLYIARGSAFELDHWISTAIERTMLDPTFGPRAEELTRVLNGLIQAQRVP